MVVLAAAPAVDFGKTVGPLANNRIKTHPQMKRLNVCVLGNQKTIPASRPDTSQNMFGI